MVRHVIVVGAGPGGLSAAINLAGLGLKVTVVEKDAVPGGRILAEVEGAGGVLRDAIPREGLRVTRRWQRGRDVDGRIHQWIGRRVRARHDLPPRAIVFDEVSGLASVAPEAAG